MNGLGERLGVEPLDLGVDQKFRIVLEEHLRKLILEGTLEDVDT